jgi:hypothetical protein
MFLLLLIENLIQMSLKVVCQMFELWELWGNVREVGRELRAPEVIIGMCASGWPAEARLLHPAKRRKCPSFLGSLWGNRALSVMELEEKSPGKTTIESSFDHHVGIARVTQKHRKPSCRHYPHWVWNPTICSPACFITGSQVGPKSQTGCPLASICVTVGVTWRMWVDTITVVSGCMDCNTNGHRSKKRSSCVYL